MEADPIAVLVVEDHGAVRRLVRDVLRDAGYNVVAVGSCREAMSLLSERPFALVIADMRLLDGSGDKLVEPAAARGCSILLMSGDPAAFDALDAGPIRVMTKPFRPRELLDAVAELTRVAS
jgi:DNA-binding NtrC family response regulator